MTLIALAPYLTVTIPVLMAFVRKRSGYLLLMLAPSLVLMGCGDAGEWEEETEAGGREQRPESRANAVQPIVVDGPVDVEDVGRDERIEAGSRVQRPESRANAVQPIVVNGPVDVEDVEQFDAPGQELESVATLRNLLVGGDYGRRVRAAATLGALGEGASGAASDLASALKDEAGAVRVAAALALWRVTRNTEPTLPMLRALLAQGDRAVRIDASLALGAMGQAAQPAVDDLLRSLAAAHPAAGWQVPYAGGSAEVPRDWVGMSERSAAAEALGQIGDGHARVVAALRALLNSNESFERQAAAAAISTLPRK